MARGFKTGGRKPGTPNKATIYRNELADEGRKHALESGISPLKLLLLVSQGAPEAEHITARQIDAAKAVLPYTTPRLAAHFIGEAYSAGQKVISHEERLYLLERGPDIDGEAEEVERP